MGRPVHRPARKGQPSQPISVVTGGAGFLGSHLADCLLRRGHKVVVVDNLVTGSVDNIAHLAGNQDFRFIEQDVTEFLFLDMPVDYVWHFASPASPVDYLELPIQTLKVGSLGTHKALGLALHKSARFLLASTSEGCYDESKRFAEALTMAYHREHGVETRIARIFNTYGPRMRLRDGRVVPAFISQALRNQPLTVFGRGGQTRSFCYCSDLIEGVYRLMQSRGNEPVNLGNPAELTVLQFARQIIAATGSRSKISFRPLPQDDPRQRRPDIGRARSLLRWRPRVALAEGLVNTIDYFRRKLGR
ncbi:MAG: NAD-dependent epimerase/dehydratase family protein [Verrucomicrobiota bacterium]